MSQLNAGDAMPSLAAKDLDGNAVDITESVAGSWALIQFYRGDW